MAKAEVTKRILDLPALSMRASVAPESLDAEKRTVDVIWTTGAPVLRGYFDKFWEELDLSPKAVRMSRLQSGAAPFLDTHDAYNIASVIGVVESARLDGKRGIATIRFAKDEAGSAAFDKVRDGIVKNISVGYRIHKLEKISEGTDEIPVMRATDWEPMEISLVPMPADAGATVRGASAATNPCEFIAEEKRMKKKDTPAAADDDDSSSAAESDSEDSSSEEARATTTEQAEEIRLAERGRISDIRSVAATLKSPAELVERVIAEGLTTDKARALLVNDYAEREAKKDKGQVMIAGTTGIQAGEADVDKFRRGASDWLYTRAGVSDKIAQAAKLKGDVYKVDAGEYRGILSCAELARMCLERAGVKTRGMGKMELVGEALTHRLSGFNTTSDFPLILENVMHKVLLAEYAITPDTWTKFSAVGSVADFRAHPRYRLGSIGVLQPLNEHGEIANQSVPDAYKESISATTKASIIGLSRQSLINDDMSAFSRIATKIGRAARLSIETDVYKMLALNAGLGPVMSDNKTLFHADHGNIGTGAALSATSIDADRVLMKSQKDPSGNELLDLVPQVLLVPASLGGLARSFNDSRFYNTAPGGVQQFEQASFVVGLYSTIVDTARITGTRRYSFASPSDVQTVEVVFLDGQQEPFMEIQNGWRVDGVEWKCRLDYGVGALDWRGAVTNAGA